MTRDARAARTIVQLIREHLDERGFVEVETPILTRSTPEGARDFLVPSRLLPGDVLRAAAVAAAAEAAADGRGQDRYYQIVRCFRDEAPRADRGFEFTQLDVEMSFVDEEDVIALIEPLFARLVPRSAGSRSRCRSRG